jgi:predicted ester cyclase
MAMEFRGIFPDLYMNIVDVICEGDKMAIRLEETGTMKGELKGIQPTGKRMNITTAYFYRFVDGKTAEVLSFGDTLTFYQQLGIPIPNQ